jgi:hypothetical protein
MGGCFPVFVADDEDLESIVGDCQFEQGTSPFLAGRVGVLEKRGHGNVDWFCPGVDEGDHLLSRNLALDFIMNVRLVMAEDVEHRLVRNEICSDVRLSLLVLEQSSSCIRKRRREALDILC